jgi:MFS family permease
VSAIRRPPAPVGRYYAFEVTQAAAFTLPIFAVFFRARGLGLAEIGLVEAAFTVVALLAETPTGYVGDRLGRRRTLALSAALAGAGAVGFALADSLAAFLAVVCVRAVAGALRSGTGPAWLYETLAAREGPSTSSFARYRGRASALSRAAAAGSVLVGGVLYAIDPVAPWLVEAGVVAAGAVAAAAMPEPPRTDRRDDAGAGEGHGGDGTGPGSPGVDPAPLAAFLAAGSVVLGPGLRRFVVYTGVVAAVGAGTHVVLQPAAVGMAGLAPAHLGALYAVLVTAGALSADRAAWVRERLGTERWFALVPPVVGAAALVAALVPPLVLVAVLGVWVLRSVSGPLVDQYLNDRIDGAGRATALSAAAMARGTVVAPTKLAVGAAAGASLPLSVAGLGAALVVAAAAAVVLGGVAAGGRGVRGAGTGG